MNPSEEPRPSGEKTSSRPNAADVAGAFKAAFDQLGKAMTPPENAEHHFRLARKHALMGIRELIDLRISHLSKSEKTGTRIVVD